FAIPTFFGVPIRHKAKINPHAKRRREDCEFDKQTIAYQIPLSLLYQESYNTVLRRRFKMQVPLLRLQCGVNSYEWGKKGNTSAAARFAAATPSSDLTIQDDKPYAEVSLKKQLLCCFFIVDHAKMIANRHPLNNSSGWAHIPPTPPRTSRLAEP